MKLEYDLNVRALYIRIGDGDVARTRQLDSNTNADLDEAGNVLGVEVVSVDHPWALGDVLTMDGLRADDRTELQAYFTTGAPVVSFPQASYFLT